MAIRRLILSSAVAAALGVALIDSPASAKRVTCADVQAGLADGKSFTEVRESLGTTDARVEACARIADQRARIAARRESVHAERAARRLQLAP